MRPVSRPIHFLDPNAAHPSKAPVPPAGGTVEASSRAGAVPGMKPKETPLAGYLMARAAMHHKVEGQDLKNLRAGNASVQEVNDLLPLALGANIRGAKAEAPGIIASAMGMFPDPT
ncbi:MAG TPA: hypothetical protein VK465_11640 [Fibrobacteria bacterium]|nr:hypothetical protein [Fibrobacteria bacterium]